MLKQSKKQWFLIYLKGIGMGTADIIPGVSGATIALITGIYERFISSIQAISLYHLSFLFKGKMSEFFRKTDFPFLFVLLLGIGTAFLIFVPLLSFLFLNYDTYVWGFFFGLMLMSSWLVLKSIPRWSVSTLVTLISGIVIGFWVSQLPHISTSNSFFSIFISGAIAICAMILPGISGSFVLLIIGKYTFIISSLRNFDFPVVSSFVFGAICGLFSFSRILTYLLEKHHSSTLSFMAGIMIGSLNKIWPFKKTISTYVDRHGQTKPLVEKNIWIALVDDKELFFVSLLALVAISIVVIIERLNKPKSV